MGIETPVSTKEILTQWIFGDQNRLDANDTLVLKKNWNKNKCGPHYNWRCDFDNSGSLDASDSSAVTFNWNHPIASNQLSLFTNPYFSTGRRVDILDTGCESLLAAFCAVG